MKLALALYGHPLVNALIRPVSRKRKLRYPAYLPARVFASALLDFDGKGAGRTVEEAIAAVPSAQAQAALTTLWTDAKGDAAVFRQSVESWFDDAMERVSGWYRRRRAARDVGARRGHRADAERRHDPHRRPSVEGQDRPCRRRRPRREPPAWGSAARHGRREQRRQPQQLRLPIGWSGRGAPEGRLGLARDGLAEDDRPHHDGRRTHARRAVWFDALGKIAPLRATDARPAKAQP